MLERTFLHIQGIGPKTEQILWDRGIVSWQDYLKNRPNVFKGGKDALVRKNLQESMAHRSDAAWFASRLSSMHMWRLFGAFSKNVVYLDIETCDWGRPGGEITLIGLYDGRQTTTYISGKNLSDFEEAVAGYDCMVTFNGACFDLPVIRRVFPHIHLPPIHIDLRFTLQKLGVRGGLKAIETRFGIARPPGVAGLSGLDAESLWRAYQRGNAQALDTLTAYNEADIKNLEPLMEWAYAGLCKVAGFEPHSSTGVLSSALIL